MSPDVTHHKLLHLLRWSGARYRLMDHAPEGRTDAASRLRCHPLSQSAKSLVIRVSVTKRTRRYLLAVIPGDTQVDLARLTRVVGGTKAAFAVSDVAERLAGTRSGSIPPFSFHPDLELIVDPSLLVHQEIYFNAARLDRSVALRTTDYLKLTNPRIEQIATSPPATKPPRSASGAAPDGLLPTPRIPLEPLVRTS
jgi:Ala-tRNA(Pro) deacylase